MPVCFGLAGLPVVPSLGLVWPGPVLPALPWPGPATTTTIINIVGDPLSPDTGIPTRLFRSSPLMRGMFQSFLNGNFPYPRPPALHHRRYYISWNLRPTELHPSGPNTRRRPVLQDDELTRVRIRPRAARTTWGRGPNSSPRSVYTKSSNDTAYPLRKHLGVHMRLQGWSPRGLRLQRWI